MIAARTANCGELLLLARLPAAHRPKTVPAGPKQRRHLPLAGDSFGRTAPMFQSVLVARPSATALSTVVHDQRSHVGA
jgi:hypothetical protein